MKCVLIVSSGEKSEGASELHRMGYELELYPSTADLSPLRDAREEESASYLGRSPASAERSHVRSLRASFIRLLEDRNYAGSDLIISEKAMPCRWWLLPAWKRLSGRK